MPRSSRDLPGLLPAILHDTLARATILAASRLRIHSGMPRRLSRLLHPRNAPFPPTLRCSSKTLTKSITAARKVCLSVRAIPEICHGRVRLEIGRSAVPPAGLRDGNSSGSRVHENHLCRWLWRKDTEFAKSAFTKIKIICF